MSVVSEVLVCPTCHGSGGLIVLPHHHDWRLVYSSGGPGHNLQRYVCMEDGCEATHCSDCAAEGLDQCAPFSANAVPARPSAAPGEERETR